jgi:hypothetical protein
MLVVNFGMAKDALYQALRQILASRKAGRGAGNAIQAQHRNNRFIGQGRFRRTATDVRSEDREDQGNANAEPIS